MVQSTDVLLKQFAATHLQVLTQATAHGVTHVAHTGVNKIKTHTAQCVEVRIKIHTALQL